MPGAVKLLAAVKGVAPPDQEYDTPPVADTLIDAVVQVRTGVPVLFVIVAVGAVLFEVVVTLAVFVHPLAAVTVTVNVPAVLTVIAAVVAPVDHK